MSMGLNDMITYDYGCAGVGRQRCSLVLAGGLPSEQIPWGFLSFDSMSWVSAIFTLSALKVWEWFKHFRSIDVVSFAAREVDDGSEMRPRIGLWAALLL